jgi:hypothetical protein
MSVAESGADPHQLRMSSTVLHDPCESIIIDVVIAGHTARTLIVSGANACFVSDRFFAEASLAYCESKHKSAALANKSSALIRGQTEPLNLAIQSFSAPAVLQGLDDLDGVDAVIGLNFLRTHNIDVLSQKLAVSIPMPQGLPLIVKSAPQQSAFSEYSVDHVGVVSGARPAKLVAYEECQAYIGYIKELNPGADGESTTSATAPPAEYVAYESELLREFADVIRDEVQLSLPPERTLPDGRKIEY